MPDRVLEIYCTDREHAVYLINYLFGVPLYAFYVLELERFQEGEIEGALMTVPFQFFGPFDTFAEAVTLTQSLCKPDTQVDAKVNVS